MKHIFNIAIVLVLVTSCSSIDESYFSETVQNENNSNRTSDKLIEHEKIFYGLSILTSIEQQIISSPESKSLDFERIDFSLKIVGRINLNT